MLLAPHSCAGQDSGSEDRRRAPEMGLGALSGARPGRNATGSAPVAAAISSIKDRLANWICSPTGPRRCAVGIGSRGRARVPPSPIPGQPLVHEPVGLGGQPEPVQRLRRETHQLAGEALARVAFVGVDVVREKPLLSNT